MFEGHPNYTNLHNIDPSRVEPVNRFEQEIERYKVDQISAKERKRMKDLVMGNVNNPAVMTMVIGKIFDYMAYLAYEIDKVRGD